MYSFRGALLLAAAVLPSASAQSVCQTGWTQAPSTSDWGSKCYRELGPTAAPGGSEPITGGYLPSGCKAACKNESATARMLCLASEAENNFVTKQAYMDGWVAFTQNSSRSDYAEPADGWGWECGSTYVPTWDVNEPNNRGRVSGDASCAVLLSDSTVTDKSCLEGDGGWSRSALLGPYSRCCAHALTTRPMLRSALHLRGQPDDTNLHRLRGPELRGQWRREQRARPVPRRIMR